MNENLIKNQLEKLDRIDLLNLDAALDTVIVNDVFNEGFLSETTRQEISALSELVEEVIRYAQGK